MLNNNRVLLFICVGLSIALYMSLHRKGCQVEFFVYINHSRIVSCTICYLNNFLGYVRKLGFYDQGWRSETGFLILSVMEREDHPCLWPMVGRVGGSLRNYASSPLTQIDHINLFTHSCISLCADSTNMH